MDIKQTITDIVNQKLINSTVYLLSVKVGGGKIAVTIESEGLVSINDCTMISRGLHSELENSSVFENYELEVSSPGMDEPLIDVRQYRKRLNQLVDVVTIDGLKQEGKLLSVNQDVGITLEIVESRKINGKKQITTITKEIKFTEIKSTVVNFSYNKILN